MADLSQVQLSDLLDKIKREARVKGTDQLDTFITQLINEMLLEYCLNNRYFEMLTLNSPIATLQSTGTYTLPTGFQLLRLARYQRSDGFKYTLKKRTEWAENPPGRLPKFYEVSSLPASINVFPFDDVPAGDTLLLDYYQYPNPLQNATDIFPIPRLIPAIKQRCVYRALVYNNQIPSAQALKADAAESEQRSKPSSTIS